MIVTLALATGTTFATIPALAYEDAGRDPRDALNSRDVRATVRKVTHTDDGRRLIVVVRLFEAKDQYQFNINYLWRVRVMFDARGGRSFDDFLRVWSDDMAGGGCVLRLKHRRFDCERLHTSDDGTSLRVTLRLRPLRPTKRIAWRVVTGDDAAPDVGRFI
jgi:hypothetical protein